jgi:hypothetical protein
MANNLELESMRIDPVRGITVLTIFGKISRLVKDFGAVRLSPMMRFSDDSAARYQECDVMEARTMTRVGDAGFA